MIRQFLLVACALGFLTTTAARAHSVWIEPTDENQLVIRFAEPSGNLEKSPGYLDSLSAPMAFVLVTNTPVSVDTVKKSDHFLLVGAAMTNTACAETSFTVRAGRKPLFYARWQPSGAGEGKPMLTLDLVPTGKAGEVRLYFHGQPLGGIKATLHTPNGDEKDVTADSEGFFHLTTTETGQYLLTVAHQREPLSGFHNGIAYTETSHNCSLVWEQSK